MKNICDYDHSRKLLIIGSGGHSKVITDIAKRLGFCDVSYFENLNDKSLLNDKNSNHEILENFNDYFFVAIGDNYTRERCFNEFTTNHPKAKAITLIDPSSFISNESEVNEGVVVMPLCVINCYTKIEKGVIINTSSSIDHDNKLKKFSSTAPGVITGGNVEIGQRSAILISSSIKHGIKIGDDVVIGGASFVINNIPNKSLAYGTPAKRIRERLLNEKYL